MWKTVLKNMAKLELEEKILNLALLMSIVGIFFPWMSGEWLGGDRIQFTGFQFYTVFLGFGIFFLQVFTLSITLVPLAGGRSFLKKRYKDVIRLCTTAQATVLCLAALSVLTKITFEFSRVEVRFGLYITLIGSMVSTLYTFLRYQEQNRHQIEELFHYPETEEFFEETQMPPNYVPPPPPPPPPASEPEEHRLHPSKDPVVMSH